MNRFKSEIKWKTEEAYNLYKSEHFNKITCNIFEKSKNGTDYTGFDELDHDVVILINYFESLVVGIEQEIYNEKMMQDFLKDSIYKSVKAFILGESGEVLGRTWESKKGIIEPQEQPFLMKLYEKWFPDEPKLQFKNKLP